MMLQPGREFMSAVAARAVHRLILGSIDKFNATPFDIGDNSFTLRWGDSPVNMEIYPDGVSFFGPGVDRRLERYDYDDLTELVDEALAALDIYLNKI